MKTKLPYVGMAVLLLLTGMLADRLAFADTAVAPSAAPSAAPSVAPSAPRFKSIGGWVLAARTADEQTVTAATKRYGVEVYEDTTNGNVIYLTEKGSISVAAPKQ